MSGFNFNFDPENFGLGVLAGWGTAYALYRARHIISAARESLSEQASSAQEYATRSADRRYITDLIRYCQADHLLGCNLTDVLIEPRFIPQPELAELKDEDDLQDAVFDVVPMIPDHPYLHAPYNIETMSIEDLGNGSRAVALLGVPGSGRTTALHAIALWSLGEEQFDPPTDPVQALIEASEEPERNDSRRARQIRELIRSQQMATEETARQRPDPVERRRGYVPVFRQMTPVYVHMGNVSTNMREFGRNVDPAEPIVRAIQHYVTRVTAKTLPRNIYGRLNEGRVLLLLDGYDELTETEQQQKLPWLEALLDQYGDNFIIVTGPAAGYGGLVDVGFTPTFLRPWHDINVNRFVDKMASAPLAGSRRRRAPLAVDDTVIEMIKSDSRGLSPYEITLKARSLLEDIDLTHPEGWMRSLLVMNLSESEDILGHLLPNMKLAAALQFDSGYITALQLEEFATGQSITPIEEAAPIHDTPLVVDDDDDLLDEIEAAFGQHDLESESDDEDQYDEVDKRQQPEEDDQPDTQAATDSSDRKLNKEYIRFINTLYKAGILVRYRGDRYQFRHPLIAAYLASLYLRDLSPDARMEKAYQSSWQLAFTYAAMHTDLQDVVDLRLEAEADVLRNNLVEMARWVAFADERWGWQHQIVEKLGSILLANDQFISIRERAAAALVSTRHEDAISVFMQGLKHPVDDVKRLACLGVGVFRVEDALDTLVELTAYANVDVTLAAAAATGAIGTDPALEELAVTLTSAGQENRQLARIVAETFALLPAEGYPLLFDAVQHESMFLRRAAVFGLKRIKTPWALIALYQRAMEDDQFYVKAAAETSLNDLLFGPLATGVRPYPEIATIGWLREWMMETAGETSETDQEQVNGKSPEQYLISALESGSLDHQYLAVMNIGQLGIIPYATLLYDMLYHEEPAIREAAVRSLGYIQLQIGQPLPSPV